jgi:hypothetical protein
MICGRETEELQRDHCHLTDKNRGWLCKQCNLGLGMFKDDIEILKRAIVYLQVRSFPAGVRFPQIKPLFPQPNHH